MVLSSGCDMGYTRNCLSSDEWRERFGATNKVSQAHDTGWGPQDSQVGL